MKYALPPLPYSYNALEPFLDAQTMELHHAKHHATYVNKLNEAVEKEPTVSGKKLEELLANLNSVPESIRAAVRNHGGGHYNHSLFWQMLAPQGRNGTPVDAVVNLKEDFNKIAVSLFGSGWIWVVKDNTGALSITTTANQDTPLSLGKKPVLGLDLWEHAYYLKYQNRRVDYVSAWWNIINWNFVASLLQSEFSL